MKFQKSNVSNTHYNSNNLFLILTNVLGEIYIFLYLKTDPYKLVCPTRITLDKRVKVERGVCAAHIKIVVEFSKL